MSELQKRVPSAVENGEHGPGGKKPRASDPLATEGVVKQERRGRAEGEGSQGGEGERAVVVVQAPMEEAQINVKLGVGLLHCQACLLPLKPPTFKCEAGHVVCSACRGSHGQGCPGAVTYVACGELDAVVRDAKVPCTFEESGCTTWVVYYEAVAHQRSCRFAPCFCPDAGCEFFSSPARLVEHFDTHHHWPVTKVGYGKPCKLTVPEPTGRHVLVGEADGCVFLVAPCALAGGTAVSLVCVRANGDAATGAPQFRCKLWAEVEANKENLALVTSMVASSDLSAGFVPTEQGMYLLVPPKLLHDESGEAPALKLRIDKAGAGAGGAMSPSATPPSRGTKRQQ